jgi:uncharacterized membrane protein YphA (DoxX/SURF4 family)
MKLVINITRIIVGLLFIFSGLVKANDPLGLSYKMQEFFEIWNQELSRGSSFFNNTLVNFFEYLHGHSLALSILMIVFEIIAGLAVLLGWKMKFFSWLLLLLIIFFTFLTGYAYYSGKFTNCGCFGDCIPISPATSFIKDLILLGLIVFLFANRKRILPCLSSRTNTILMSAATILSLGIQWYALNYLPLADCLPFKKHNNIEAQMKMPPNAVPDVYDIRFVYKKDGKQYEFALDQLPKDIATYTFVDQKKRLVKKGSNNEPPIKGFSLKGESDIDSTSIVLNQPYSILLFCENFSTPVEPWKNRFAILYTQAQQRNIPVYLVSTSIDEASKTIAGTPFANIQIFKCDYTAIRTAARTNPCIYLLKQGTVVNKWSYKNLDKAIETVKAIK